MRNTTLMLGVLGWLFAFSALAQNTANPDAPPVRQEEGPIKVMNEPPKKKPERAPSALDKLRLGGSIGPLSFGTVTSIGVSPVAGYQVTDRLALGAGVTYQYTSIRYRSFGSTAAYKESYDNYGGRVFGMFNVFESINLNAEYETLNVQYRDYLSNGIARRKWINSALVGASYSTPIGGRFIKAFNIMLLYNLSYNSLVNPSYPSENIYPTSSPLVIRAVLF
ncbi:hypothetical protein [Runella zeae]|jgi:hypothetical protein|uniref:hypothetical protein n=1 Tax=Runella zeae TaxID=94255 RepID=UPI000684B9B6|nr:hypothetical protein [Runella zeae]